MIKFFAPISGVVQNIFALQDINNDQKLELMRTILNNKLDVVNFRYLNTGTSEMHQEASLSWRLTAQKNKILLKQLISKFNQKSVKKLIQLMQNTTQ